jgi:hypothetical protein
VDPTDRFDIYGGLASNIQRTRDLHPPSPQKGRRRSENHSRTDITVKDICEGFVYNQFEGKGLFGLGRESSPFSRNTSGTISMPTAAKEEAAVIESLLKGYPLGLIYFNKVA